MTRMRLDPAWEVAGPPLGGAAAATATAASAGAAQHYRSGECFGGSGDDDLAVQLAAGAALHGRRCVRFDPLRRRRRRVVGARFT